MGGRCRSTPCWPPYRIFTINLEKTKLSVDLAPDVTRATTGTSFVSSIVPSSCCGTDGATPDVPPRPVSPSAAAKKQLRLLARLQKTGAVVAKADSPFLYGQHFASRASCFVAQGQAPSPRAQSTIDILVLLLAPPAVSLFSLLHCRLSSDDSYDVQSTRL